MAAPNVGRRSFADIAMTHPSKTGIPHCGIPWESQMRRRTGDFSFRPTDVQMTSRSEFRAPPHLGPP